VNETPVQLFSRFAGDVIDDWRLHPDSLLVRAKANERVEVEEVLRQIATAQALVITDHENRAAHQQDIRHLVSTLQFVAARHGLNAKVETDNFLRAVLLKSIQLGLLLAV
jgi:hypothetical protein